MFKKLAFLLIVTSLALTACGGGAAPAEEKASCAPNCEYTDMTFCYPQLGAESDWRTANTASFKETAGELGV
ncbi:MAG: LacI family transcriptional regulator, partial [Anaerolineales bacterium]